MIGWIYRILVGNFINCHHTWVTRYEQQIVDNEIGEVVYGYNYYMRCSKCGNVKKVRL